MKHTRQVSRDLSHIKEHLERAVKEGNYQGDVRMALGIVISSIKREEEAGRKNEKAD